MRRREDPASVMGHENEIEVVLPIHVQEDKRQHSCQRSLEGERTGKVPEGKEKWSAGLVPSREELEMEHEPCKGAGSSHMVRRL